MSKDLNKVQLTGRLGAAPETRATPQGHTVTTFRVASNRSWRSEDGATHEETEWFRVVAWNKLAEICTQWLSKGSRVYIEGRLQTRQWQDQEGQTRIATEVIASDMIILDGRRDSVASEPPAAPAVSPAKTSPARAASSSAASAPAITTAATPATPLPSRAVSPATAPRLKAPPSARPKIVLEEEDLPLS